MQSVYQDMINRNIYFTNKFLKLDCRQIACLIFILFLFYLPAISCKKEETKAISSLRQHDTGIAKTIEQGPAAVTLNIDRKEITIAEKLNLTISITIDEDYNVKLPEFGEKLGRFGIVDYSTTQPTLTQNNRKTISRSYVLEPFLSGEYKIPPMAVMFWKKGDQESGSHKIETPEVTIMVKSLLPEDMKKVKLNEIKPPVPFPVSLMVWLWVTIGVVVLAITGVAVVMIISKRRNAGKAQVLKRPAHELAYEALDQLVQEDLISRGKIKLFYQRISDIFRRYIENRFKLRAPEQTTEEFLAGLEKVKNFPEQYKGLLKTFLRHCDLVKFAEYQPHMEDIQSTLDSCKAFIQGTEEKE